MSYLSIRDIKKSFKKSEVLKGINIDIEKGELVCFLGPSGCGKTTLLRIIAGLESCNIGSISVNNKDITKLQPSQRNIGIVFQSYSLFPNMTIYENIAYGLKNGKVNKSYIDDKVNRMMEMVDLVGMENKYPSELSGGQQQRVAIARAIILEPEILLLDEPLSALDAKVRETLRTEIKNIQRKLNITTILVTHDQEEAVSMGDKIVVFNKGNVMQIGEPEEIYYNPHNDFVADFIGKANFIKGKDGDTRVLRPECIEFSVSKKLNYTEGIIKDMEFRGTIYRATIELNTKKKDIIYLDISWKEKIKNRLGKNKIIYLDLNEVLGEYKYA